MESEEKQMNEATLELCRQLAYTAWAIREDIKEKEKEINQLNEIVSQKERELQGILELANVDEFVATDCRYYLKHELGVRPPQSEDDWLVFKAYMKEKDANAYESFFKMHVTSLKAYVKKEIELAEADGNFDLRIPGLPPFSPYTYVKPRRR
jgi:hypothetical protein